MTLSSRQWIPIVTVAVALLAGVAVLVGISGDDQSPAAADRPPDLNDVLTSFAASLRPDASYQPPTANEREDIVTALNPLFVQSPGIDRSRVAESLRPLGFTLTVETDSATGRQ